LPLSISAQQSGRRFKLRASIIAIIAAPGPAIVVVVAVVPLSALLKLRGYRSSRVTLSIADIDIGAVATGNGIAAIASTAAIIVLPRGLLLWWQVAVGVAHPVAGAHVPAVATRWRVSGHAILDLLHGGLKVHGRQSLTRE
jgi:hypothetical protein